jgi:hypothetical protein
MIKNLENNSIIEYISITEAALFLGFSRFTLRKYIDNQGASDIFTLFKKACKDKEILNTCEVDIKTRYKKYLKNAT